MPRKKPTIKKTSRPTVEQTAWTDMKEFANKNGKKTLEDWILSNLI